MKSVRMLTHATTFFSSRNWSTETPNHATFTVVPLSHQPKWMEMLFHGMRFLALASCNILFETNILPHLFKALEGQIRFVLLYGLGSHIMKCIRLFHMNGLCMCVLLLSFERCSACACVCDLVRFFVLSSHRVVASRNIKYLAILSE